MKKVSCDFTVQPLRVRTRRIVLHCTTSHAHTATNLRVALGLRAVCPHWHSSPAPRGL
jgi:hypothetical protein